MISPLRSHKRLTKEVELHEAMNKQLTIPCKRYSQLLTCDFIYIYIYLVWAARPENANDPGQIQSMPHDLGIHSRALKVTLPALCSITSYHISLNLQSNMRGKPVDAITGTCAHPWPQAEKQQKCGKDWRPKMCQRHEKL